MLPVDADYTKTEKDTICVGLKNLVASKRVTLRTVQAIQENPKYTRYTKALERYADKMNEEIYRDAQSIVDVLVSYAIERKGNSSDSEAYFLKLTADFLRYQCEVLKGNKLKEMKEQTSNYYKRAEKIADKLHYCSSTRMSIALNHGCFIYEVMMDTKRANQIVNIAMSKAQQTLGSCDEEVYVEAVHIMEMMRENQAIWKGDDPTKLPPMQQPAF